MRNKIILTLIVLGSFYGCITPKYTILKHSEIQSLDLDKIGLNYIPLEDEMLAKSAVLDSAYKLLSAKKYMTLESYIKKLEESGASSSDFYLAQTLSAITNLNYSGARTSLMKVDGKENKMLKMLLSIDLNYEIERADAGLNFKAYLQKYQDLIDLFPDNAVLRKIVAIRLRYLRYNY
ncbi:MAG: hypothetical protein WCG08_05105 [Paludibacter sp.]